jgi:hypothetical protein
MDHGREYTSKVYNGIGSNTISVLVVKIGSNGVEIFGLDLAIIGGDAAFQDLTGGHGNVTGVFKLWNALLWWELAIIVTYSSSCVKTLGSDPNILDSNQSLSPQQTAFGSKHGRAIATEYSSRGFKLSFNPREILSSDVSVAFDTPSPIMLAKASCWNHLGCVTRFWLSLHARCDTLFQSLGQQIHVPSN